MSEIQDKITATPRSGSGKSVTRKLRAAGIAPAVVYGTGREATALSVNATELVRTRREFGASHIYSVDVEGGDSFRAYIREIQVDAVTREIQHVDFWAVDMDKPVTMEVRLEIEGRSKGVVAGGHFEKLRRVVRLTGLPTAMPDKVVLDISELGAGETYHVSDLVLPEGVAPAAGDDNYSLASVSIPK
jgi:large subunit ribosomal protein L25